MRRLFKLWSLAGHDLRVLFAVLRMPNRPPWLLPALLALAAFGLDPLNIAIPMLGAVDEFVLLPLIIRVLAYFAEASTGRLAPRRDDRVVSIQ